MRISSVNHITTSWGGCQAALLSGKDLPHLDQQVLGRANLSGPHVFDGCPEGGHTLCPLGKLARVLIGSGHCGWMALLSRSVRRRFFSSQYSSVTGICWPESNPSSSRA